MTFPENIRGSLEMLDPKALLHHVVINIFLIGWVFLKGLTDTLCYRKNSKTPAESSLSSGSVYPTLFPTNPVYGWYMLKKV